MAQDGIMRLKDGRELTAKQFVEEFLLQNEDLRHLDLPSRVITRVVKSEDPWEKHEERKERLSDYYRGKIEFMQNAREILNNNYVTIADIKRVIEIYKIGTNELNKSREDVKQIVAEKERGPGDEVR